MFKLKEAISATEFNTGIDLFKEYASQIAIDLGFQNFDNEIKHIKDQYSRPEGILFIAYDSEMKPIGCTGIRKLESNICELKRMYVRQNARGLGLGKQLVLRSIQAAKELEYDKMRLDTLPVMKTAIKLYKSMGFYEITPYRFNPNEGTKYMEIIL